MPRPPIDPANVPAAVWSITKALALPRMIAPPVPDSEPVNRSLVTNSDPAFWM